MKLGLILFLFICSGVSAKSSHWSKYYKLVMNDIRSIEKLPKKDLSLKIRLFELYGEKLTLLLEKESEYRIAFIKGGNTKKVKKLLRNQKTILLKIERMARSIESQTRNIKILTKISYFRALNYKVTKKYKKFYSAIKKAERINKDKKMRGLINLRLAEYHFNNKQYKESSKYYKRIVNNKKNPWLTKHYYNLAWSELKLNNFNRSIKFIRIAYKYEKKKGYVRIGDQLIDSILLFHAYSRRTKEGFRYMVKHRLNSFDHLIKYLHYVFENGEKKDTLFLLGKIEKMKLDLEQQYVLLSKRILIYRTIKFFAKLQNKINEFKKKIKNIKKRKLTKETKLELVKSITGYSGYLQELVKSKRLLSVKRQGSYVKYISANFNTLRSIDKKNMLKYYFYEGETFFSLDRFTSASNIYIRALKKYKRNSKKNEKFLLKIFESLFKSLEKQDKVSSTKLMFTYRTYLKFYPRGQKANLIYKKLLNLYYQNKNYGTVIASLKVYNRRFPKEIKFQKNLYKKILNKYIDRKDVGKLSSLLSFLKEGYLGFTKKESSKVRKIISQIYFSKYEKMAENGKVLEAIAGFDTLHTNKKSLYSLRVDSLRKKMFYENQESLFRELAKSLHKSIRFFNKEKTQLNRMELLFYTENVCLGDLKKQCVSLMSNIVKAGKLKLPKKMLALYFKLRVLIGPLDQKLYSAAHGLDDKNFLFKILMIRSPNFRHKLFNAFYKLPTFRGIIEVGVNSKIIKAFYRTLDFDEAMGFIKRIKIINLKARVYAKLTVEKNIVDEVKFTIMKTPEEAEITEEIFVAFGSKIDSSMATLFNNINNLIKKADPSYLPYLLSKIIIRYENEVRTFKKFIPHSKNVDLKKAMTDAVSGLHKIFDQRASEYRALYTMSLDKTISGSGAKLYRRNVMTTPYDTTLGRSVLWQK